MPSGVSNEDTFVEIESMIYRVGFCCGLIWCLRRCSIYCSFQILSDGSSDWIYSSIDILITMTINELIIYETKNK